MKTICVVFLFVVLCCTNIYSKNNFYKFSHLTTENGLSSNNVTTIFKDSRGFMWFGTSDGLNKFDGHKITIYKHDPDDSLSISNNNINKIIEEKDVRLWIGTQNDINVYDP